MARYRDDGEVQIDNSTKVHFRNAFQQLIMIAALNVGTLLILNRRYWLSAPKSFFNKTLFWRNHMDHRSSKSKLSIGTLRKAKMKTKPRSPDLIGELHLQRHTFEAIEESFENTDQNEIVCPIAARGYSEEGELSLTVQLSPPYQATKKPKPEIMAALFGDADKE
jgi:hypothetical protein